MFNPEDPNEKKIHLFGEAVASPLLDKELLGEKGLRLVEESLLGLPIPFGCILTTEVFFEYLKAGKKLTNKITNSILDNLSLLEKQSNCILGSRKNPLLISIKPSATTSLSGMEEILLKLGLNDQSVEGFVNITNNERLAYDTYRHFIMTYGEIIGGISKLKFQNVFNAIKIQEGADLDIDLSIEGLKEICDRFKNIYLKETSQPFPQNCHEQIFSGIINIFNNHEMNCKSHSIVDNSGVAVVIQKIVFGNKNDRSASGIAFTRNPSTGENCIYGEFLANARNDEVISGIRSSRPINSEQRKHLQIELPSFEEFMPEVYSELKDIVKKLESHYKGMQEIEFVVEDEKLYIIHTQSGKKTGLAAVRIAHEMYEEGLIDEESVIQKVTSNHFQQLFTPIFNEKIKNLHRDKLVTHGINVGPGAASGAIAFSSAKAIEMKAKGIACILVKEESTIEDFQGMIAAEGILTLGGGSTSCTAIFAREMGKPCIVGCKALHINETAKTLSIAGQTLKEGDSISIDGLTGEVFFCQLEKSPSEIFKILVTKEIDSSNSPSYQKFKFITNLLEKYSNTLIT